MNSLKSLPKLQLLGCYQTEKNKKGYVSACSISNILQEDLNYLQWINIPTNNFIHHSLHVPISNFFRELKRTKMMKTKIQQFKFSTEN
jgi:hypothetical protein